MTIDGTRDHSPIGIHTTTMTLALLVELIQLLAAKGVLAREEVSGLVEAAIARSPTPVDVADGVSDELRRLLK